MTVRKIKLKPKKPNRELNKDVLGTTDINVPLSFNDLVIDGSLSPVAIRFSRSKKKKSSSSDNDLLTELQCEV